MTDTTPLVEWMGWHKYISEQDWWDANRYELMTNGENLTPAGAVAVLNKLTQNLPLTITFTSYMGENCISFSRRQHMTKKPPLQVFTDDFPTAVRVFALAEIQENSE